MPLIYMCRPSVRCPPVPLSFPLYVAVAAKVRGYLHIPGVRSKVTSYIVGRVIMYEQNLPFTSRSDRRSTWKRSWYKSTMDAFTDT